MTRVVDDRADERPVDQSGTEPDWRHDPRESADSRERRAHRRHRSQLLAAVLAVLLAVGGAVYLGFVTGRVSLPVLGTLTAHPADVAPFQVGRTTYLMQFGARNANHVSVFRQTGEDSRELVADLPVPAVDGISAAADPAEATYFVVLPTGAHDVAPLAADSRAAVTLYLGAAVATPSGQPLVGMVVTLALPADAAQSLTSMGLSAVHWVDIDGRPHTSAVGP